MLDERDLLIPRRLDDPPKFLFWDFDVAIFFLVGAFFGIMAGYLLSGLAIGLGIAALYSRVKSGKHTGYLMHLAYWHLPGWFNLRSTPTSSKRVFFG